jgi:uncharacterized protein
MTTYLIHGVHGHPQENWFPWLKSELEKLGQKVVVPAFPTPENQTLETWLEVFSQHQKQLDEDAVVIGHSLGTPFLLSVLENSPKPIKAAYFIAGYHPNTLPKTSEWYPMVKTFVDKEFNWQKIKANCPEFHIYHADNDPYFPIQLAHDLAKELGTTVTEVKDAGHFNEAAGYTKFPQLLTALTQ